MKIINVVFIGLILFVVSCQKHSVQKKEDFEIISPSDVKFDIVFPQELWDEIMKAAPVTLNTNKSAYDLFESLSVQIEVIDGSKEVLGGKNYRFDFREFGGEIDFNTYLKRDVIGNFKMRFNFPAGDEESNLHVFFLSWSKQFTMGDETYGNGCGYFYDVTSYFNKEVFKKGLLLHTNNYRYFDLAAGRLYLVNYTKDKIQLAQITLTDSSLEKRMCEEKL
jgi:hypothetical protein